MTRWPPAAMAAWDVPTIKQNMNLNITWVLTFAYLWGCVHVFVFLSQHYMTLHGHWPLIFLCICVWVCACVSLFVSVCIKRCLWVNLCLCRCNCLCWCICVCGCITSVCLIVLQWDKMLMGKNSRLLNKCEKEQEKLAQDIQWDSCLLFYSRVTLYVSYFGANSTDPERWDLKAQSILVSRRAGFWTKVERLCLLTTIGICNTSWYHQNSYFWLSVRKVGIKGPSW